MREPKPLSEAIIRAVVSFISGIEEWSPDYHFKVKLEDKWPRLLGQKKLTRVENLYDIEGLRSADLEELTNSCDGTETFVLSRASDSGVVLRWMDGEFEITEREIDKA